MKKAICTLAIGDEASQFAKFSHPTFQRYADKIGADFIVFDTPKVNYKEVQSINWLKFEKYQIYEVLNQYDRVAFFDTDILITPHAKDIFNTVAYDKIGGVFEDFGSDEIDRRKIIQKAQGKLGDIGWKTGYMNSGVFVVSKVHQEIFKMIFQYGVYDDFYEQTNTNWYMRKAGFEIKNISHKWNFMGIMRVFHGPYHLQAYAIHYAGGGIFPGTPRLEQIQKDYDHFYSEETDKI
jgi:lipopolysaccharide biosynthesis glycosyltransferase